MNLERIIQMGINCNYNKYIISEIASYCKNKCFQFDKNVLNSNQLCQLSFNDKLNEVIFDNAQRDFINIINNNNLLIDDCNGECRIDSYIFERGDEMWIGIINKSIYGPYISVEHNEESLFYYHRGRIHAFGKTYYQKLDKTICKYDKYDWVSFIIDKTQNKLIFYKNKLKVTEIDKLPTGNCLVYNAVVDEQNDGFFVEKIMFKNC